MQDEPAPPQDNPEKVPSNPQPEPSPASQAVPPPPEYFLIPEQLLAAWYSRPSHTVLQAPITQAQIDHLFFSLTSALNAVQATNQVMVEWSNGRVDEANKILAESRRHIIEGLNEARRFFARIIIAETQGHGDGQ
jgi:hypothetical protein